MSRILIRFDEQVRILTETLSKEAECGHLRLETVLHTLDQVGSVDSVGASTVHPLALALAQLPGEVLLELAHQVEERMESIRREMERSGREVYRALEEHGRSGSPRINADMEIDRYWKRPWYLSHVVSLEIVRQALSWVYDPPLERRSRTQR